MALAFQDMGFKSRRTVIHPNASQGVRQFEKRGIVHSWGNSNHKGSGPEIFATCQAHFSGTSFAAEHDFLHILQDGFGFDQ